MFSLVDANGASVKAGRATLPQPPAGQPYFFAFPLSVTPGKYTLRVATADAHGHVGSAEQPVGAELRRFGNFTASQLLIGWPSAAGERLLALDALPSGIDTLHASIEMYPDDAAVMATNIDVRFDFFRIGATAPIVTREVTTSATGTVLSAATDLSIVDLAAGSYSLVATIIQDGVAKGVVTAVVRRTALQ
jgi:hypothetical protein